jgi:hypothetical protein
LVVLLKPILSV